MADVRDISEKLVNWKWTWKHAGATALAVVGVVPVIGALKHADKVVDGAKGVVKVVQNAAPTIKKALDATVTAVKQAAKAVATVAAPVVKKVVNTVNNAVTSMKTAAKDTVNSIVSGVKGFADKLFKKSEPANDMFPINLQLFADKKVKADSVSNPKTYQTYTKTNPTTGEVYSGRTSGTGTPAENIRNRDANHHMNDKGFGPAKLDKSSLNKDAIRGREQQLIEINGGAKSQGGTSGNAINGIGPNNKNRNNYLEASRKEFGK